jgi:exopolysaccharide biosynthesis polyprenyl glycosylphosphotransferase
MKQFVALAIIAIIVKDSELYYSTIMLGRRQEINLQLTELIDSCIIAASLWVAYVLRAYVLQSYFPELEVVPDFEEFLWVAAVLVPFTPIILESQGYYANLLNKSPAVSIKQLASTLVWAGMVIGAFTVFFRWVVPSRTVVLIQIPIAGALLLLREAYQRDLLRRRLMSGKGAREHVLLAGLPDDVERLLQGMSDEQRADMDVRGVIDITSQPVEELIRAMHQHSISRVIFAAQHVHFGKIEEAVQACETEGIEAWISADFFQTSIAQPTFDILSGRLMLVFHSTPQASWSLLAKDVLDRIGAAFILLASAPLWIVALIGIRVTSRGPIFFRQERAGHYGKPFTMWKFRTMHTGSEHLRDQLAAAANEMDGPVFKMKNDPRIFAFGQFLRKFSIDEFPQLINVLRGEMSLVGPRPLPVFETQRIAKHAQRRRLSVKPGLTCLWQVSGRNGIKNFEDWVALDLKYIDNWSFWLDLEILLRTLPAVVRGSGAH